MKKIVSTTLLLGAMLATQGQDKNLSHAVKKYEKYSYDHAAEQIEDISRKTPDMKRKLAESYVKTNEYAQAERVYTDIMESEAATAEDMRDYAEVLMVNKKYTLASQAMEAFYELSPDDSRATRFHSNPTYHIDLLQDKGQFKIKNVGFNSAQEDFGTSYYKDKVVFASSREGVKPVRRRWNWNRLPYLDMYIAPAKSNGLGSPSTFNSSLNRKFHEGPATFNEAGDYMVFTRNNYSGTDKEGVRKLKLFICEKDGNGWGEKEAFPYNNDEFSVGHAALSPDGLTMYLASDMPGGYGGVDLYMSKRDKGGLWSKPVNMGSEINTEGNEMFPFIHHSDILLFASDGHPGLGGLDVFATQLDKKGAPGAIKNLASPINSNQDDFALILNKEMSNGYFSSNRDSGKGDDDIYYFDMLEPLTFGKRIEGVAYDKNGEILPGTEVTLSDSYGNIFGTVTTGDDGAYGFTAEPGKDYVLGGSLTDYFDGNTDTDTHGEEQIVKADLVLEKDPGFSLYGLISEKGSGTPLDGVKISLSDNLGGEGAEYVTSANGDFRRPLSGKKLNDRITYNLKMEKEGYLTKTVTYNKLLDRPGQYDVHEDLDLDLTKLEVGLDIGKAIDINPIYFDLNKYNIRPDAAVELQKIVNVMNEYPSMVIELGSHTDCRASEGYNMTLSDNRAKSSAKWVQSRIMNPDRIYGKGYGESQLVNHCACDRRDPGNKICSEEEHQMNRRTEFKIVKM